MVVQCCVCKKIRLNGNWRQESIHLPVKRDVSHGYCPICAAKAFEEIRQAQKKHELRTA